MEVIAQGNTVDYKRQVSSHLKKLGHHYYSRCKNTINIAKSILNYKFKIKQSKLLEVDLSSEKKPEIA